LEIKSRKIDYKILIGCSLKVKQS